MLNTLYSNYLKYFKKSWKNEEFLNSFKNSIKEKLYFEIDEEDLLLNIITLNCFSDTPFNIF